MLTVQQVNRASGETRLLMPPVEASINLKAGIGYDSASTTWATVSHAAFVALFAGLNRLQYAFNLLHDEIPNSYGHWYPVTFSPVVNTGGYTISVVWRRWDEPAPLEANLPIKIATAIGKEISQTNLISFRTTGYATYRGSPYYYWNLILGSAPPYNYYIDSEPIQPRYTPYPGLVIGEGPPVNINTTPEFLGYISTGFGLIDEILSDMVRSQKQTFEDVLNELREYQLAVIFPHTDWAPSTPLDPATSYEVAPTLPSASRPRHELTRALLANNLTYSASLDDKYTRPITCVYTPTNGFTGADLQLGAPEQPSGTYEYTDRPDGSADIRAPLRVKHAQKSREKAILECHLQRYKLLEEFNRGSFSLTLTEESVKWRPLDTFVLPIDAYHTGFETLGVVLGVTHSYARQGPRLTTIQSKLFPRTA